MMKEDIDQDIEFLRLASAYIDGIAADEELDGLVKRLRTDPEARKLMAKLVNQHGELRLLCAPEIWSRLGGWGSSAPAAVEPVRADDFETGWWNRKRIWRIGLAFAATLIVAVGVWRFSTIEAKTGGADVATGKGQTISLRFDGEDTVVEIAEETKLRVVGGTALPSPVANVELIKSGPSKLIQLESGSIRVSVAKQAESPSSRSSADSPGSGQGRAFAVKTQQANMRVVGTKFSVTAKGNVTRLDVEDGVVRFVRLADGAAISVPAGYFVEARAGSEQAASPLIRSTSKVGLPAPEQAAEDLSLFLAAARAMEEIAIRDRGMQGGKQDESKAAGCQDLQPGQ